MKNNKNQKKTNREIANELREQAMPEVKKLVKKYGRPAIGWCVNQLADYERRLKKLERARAEVKEMERELE